MAACAILAEAPLLIWNHEKERPCPDQQRRPFVILCSYICSGADTPIIVSALTKVVRTAFINAILAAVRSG